jgi:hypothetical protein
MATHDSCRQIRLPAPSYPAETFIKSIACIGERIDISFLNVISPITIVEYVERWGTVTLKGCCAFSDMLCSQLGYEPARRGQHLYTDLDDANSGSPGANRFLNSLKSHSADREDL